VTAAAGGRQVSAAAGGQGGTLLLDISELAVRFGPVRAVDGVSLQLPPGPCGLGLVGRADPGKRP